MPEPHIKSVAELGLTLRGAADLPELIDAAYGLDGLILHASDLAPEFFDLRSGLLGELFQKFSNLRLPVAFVLPDFTVHGERFAELAREHATHPSVRFVRTGEEARTWLSGTLSPQTL